ncbi:sodium transport system ATP-binding protein [Natronospira proteinivora]|uniref:Sodium transport system ATP-binding protein n=1 Tax=Natronospira proteinivora TaxID=1807133 RepID=A0ABT1GAX5_9GAMM|nr:ATP-binding cassette domain-containing protein [Natronospira proteinivora]MCP1728202.1 sodium transport system ATP-binding protein [Natronospira proteinivora]
MIKAEGLRKRFGKIEAVRGVSLEAADGQITGLLGPNGAGKSTSLRIISTAIGADSGQVLVDGLDVRHDPQRARLGMGVMPHDAGLYPRLTGRENIRYFARLNAVPKAEIEARIDQLSERLEMGEFVDRPAKGYSQGQRLKTALARAMVHNPRNLILDEPTSGLDVMATRALRELIRDLKKDGFCILFSSHVMQEVAALCDRIVIIAHGQVVARGRPQELKEQLGTDDLEEAFVRAIGRAEAVQEEGS